LVTIRKIEIYCFQWSQFHRLRIKLFYENTLRIIIVCYDYLNFIMDVRISDSQGVGEMNRDFSSE